MSRVWSRGSRPPHGIPDAPVGERRRTDAAPDAAIEALREIASRLMVAALGEQDAKEAAERANRGKDAAGAAIAHELRTPLNAILGWSSVLRAKPDADPSHGLSIIQHNAHAQLRLLNDLSDVARMSAGTLTMDCVPMSLTPVMESVVEAVRPAAKSKGIALT